MRSSFPALSLGLVCLAAFLPAGPSAAADGEKLPRGLPPIVGKAVVGRAEKRAEWTIQLTVPKVAWEVVGEVDPKKSWPELAADVKLETKMLEMGGPSQLAPSRVVDVRGQDLPREEVERRLAKETPVLVSVSGVMIDPYYLAVVRSDALIVLLGPRDGVPAVDLLPAKKQPAQPARR